MSNYYPASRRSWWRGLLAIGLLMGGSRAASAQWTVQNSNFSQASVGISSISIVDANTAWAPGYDGTAPLNGYNGFTRTTNGGTTWTSGFVTPAQGLNAVGFAAVSTQTAWAAYSNFNTGGGGGFIFRTTNGGTTWTTLTPAGAFPAAQGGFLDGVIAFDANTVLAIGDPVGGFWEMYRSVNAGVSWSRISSTSLPLPQAGEYAIVGTTQRSGNNVWIATNFGNVLYSNDQGLSWGTSNTGLATITQLAFSSATQGIAYDAANPNIISRTFDGGLSWAALVVSGPVFTADVAGVPGSPGTYVSVGASTAGQGSSYSTDGGFTWTAIDALAHNSVAFLNSSVGYAGGFNTNFAGGIYRGSLPTSGGSYCTANLGGTSCDITQLSIFGTTLNTVPNGCAQVNGSQYSIYPASGNTTATLAQSQVYTFGVTTNATSIISVWADWDQSGTFDASEWTQVTTASVPGTVDLVSLAVPANATLGQTRLRVRTRASGSINGSTDACTQFFSGETEDYIISIQGGTSNTSDPTPYCAASQPVGCVGPNITSVTLVGTTLVNASTCATNVVGDTYTRYPATGTTTATVQRGQTYSLNLTTDNDAITSVWVDWNQNLFFDANEWTQVYTAGLGGTVGLTVPASAVLGQTRMRVRSRVNGSPNGSTDACTQFGSGEGEDYTITVQAGTTNAYCEPGNFTSGCSNGTITNVRLTGTNLNNTTTCQLSGTGNAYTIFPASGVTTGSVQRTNTYALNVTTDLNSIVSVWVDWNQNQLFDTNEWTQIATATTPGTPATAGLLIPANATLGQTRMRIRTRAAGSSNGSNDACSAFGSGESEDYTITVLAAPNPGNVTCTPGNFAAGCGGGTITRVEVAGTTLNSVSTCQLNSFGNAYTVFPASGTTTGSVTPGTTYALRVTTSQSAIISAWADWNQNNSFDTNEWVQVTTASTAGTAAIVGWLVPASAQPGATWVRIRTRAAGSSNGPGDACSNFASGETEDYQINVGNCTLTAPVIVGSTGLCAGSTLVLAATGVPANSTYAWAGPNNFTSALSAPLIPNVTTANAGAYTLTITRAGCTGTAQPFTVAVNAAPAAVTPTGAQRCGAGTLTLTATGAPAGGAYRWYTVQTGGTAIVGATGASFTTPSLSTTTTYYVSAVGAGSCEGPRTAVVAAIGTAPTAAISAGGPISFCAGGSVTLTANGGSANATYQWTLGGQSIPNADSRTYAATQAGVYSVTVSNSSGTGCSATSAPVTVTVNPAQSAAFAYANSTYCLSGGGNATPSLTGTPGGTFTAQPAGLALTAGTGVINLSNSTAGTYVVTYTSPGPCAASTTQTLTLTNAPLATFSFATPSVCAGSVATVQPTLGAGAGTGTFSAQPVGLSIDPFSGVINVTASAVGTYTVTNAIAASGSCAAASAQALFTITAAPTATATAGGPTTFCAGGSVTLTATGTGNFLWSNGATTSSINVTQSGTYTVTVTNASQCAATSAPVTVTVNPTPATPTISATPQTGGGILLTSSAGVGNQWYLGGQPIPGATGTAYLVATSAQNGTYTVVATGLGGCESAPSLGLPVVITGTMEETAAAAGFSLWPNPTADGRLFLTLPATTAPTPVTILDATGRVVYAAEHRATAGQPVELRLTLPVGVYSVRVATTNGPLVRRLVRQ